MLWLREHMACQEKLKAAEHWVVKLWKEQGSWLWLYNFKVLSSSSSQLTYVTMLSTPVDFKFLSDQFALILSKENNSGLTINGRLAVFH